MRLTMTVDLDNAAFEDHPGTELLYLLVRAANRAAAAARYRAPVSDTSLLDSNGNTVGSWRLEV